MHTGTKAHAPAHAQKRELKQRFKDLRWLPSTEHALRLWTGALMWFSTTSVIIFLSYVPELAPTHAQAWRLSLGIPALIFVLLHIPAGRYLTDEQSYRGTVVGAFLGTAVFGVLFQITPAIWALLVALLVPTIFCGYFLRKRELIPLTAFLTIIALSSLTSPFADDTPHLASRLAAFIPAMWAILAALHAQKTQLNAALVEMRRKTYTDPLTGLGNRRALRVAAEEWLVDGRGETRVALMLIDLDNFKQANTLHGHLGGDLTLRVVAQQIGRVIPPGAVAARVGGDEFAVIAHVASKQQAQELAGLLRGAVLGARSELGLPGIEVDASVGVAMAPEDGTTLEALMTAADLAMYREKASHEYRPTREAVPTIAVAPAPPVVAWQDGERAEQTGGGRLRRLIDSRTDLANYAAFGYMIGSLALAISFAVPGADHDYIEIASLALITGPLWAIAIFLINPKNGFWTHMAIDVYTIAALSAIAALSGGAASPAAPLIFLLVIHQAWFWGRKMILWRLFTPLFFFSLPLAYQGLGAEMNPQVTAASLFASVSTTMTLVLGLYVNQLSTARVGAQARRMAATDPLTGVANRRRFNEFVERQLGGGRGGEFAIVMIDLDNFKHVNTEHGHKAGDELLCSIAEALQAAARGEDLVARVGGDEFAAVLPGAGVEGARSLAERFVHAVEDCAKQSSDSASAAVTASAGFALRPLHGDSLDALVSAADDALMSVKDSGKGTARVSRIVNAV